MIKRCLIKTFTLAFISIFLCSSLAIAGEYKIGVLAKRGAAKAVQKWSATADYLSEKIEGENFVVVPLDFEEVFPAIENGSVDFFLVNSSMFITAKVKYGATPIATMINSRQGQALKSFGGVILTYVDRDDINTLEDLKGKDFMAVKESSFGGWQMAYKELMDAGIDPTQDFASLQFGGKHDNVVFSIQNGEVDAGTVRTDTLERMAAAGDIGLDEFKIVNAKDYADFPFLVSTALYPEWPFAKHKNTPQQISEQVAETLIEMKEDSAAAKSAKIVGWTKALDYSDVETLQKLLKVGAYQ